MKNTIVILVLAFAATSFHSAVAESRSKDDFLAYAKRRIAITDESVLSEFVNAVDADGDGEVSDEEFEQRIKIYQQVFKRVAPKPKSHGSDLPKNWLTSFKDARKNSTESNKPVVAMFSASWCGPCKMMIASVFPTNEAQKALERFVPVYIDSEKETELATKNDIRAFPTFVCFDSEGNEIARKVGGGRVDDFLKMLDDFAAKQEKE